MKNGEKGSEITTSGPYRVSLRLLGALAIAYLLGLVTHLIARNFYSGQPLTFSTPELINFTLSVLLSGASIFLAIAAISLGRFSEQAITQRSDESIRLQNEVFQKTTDALQRIESSTGVTEKRIEDIISGRVGDISQKVARLATEKQGEPNLEEQIRKSIYQALREEGVSPRLAADRFIGETARASNDERDRKRVEYRRLSTQFMQALSMRDDLKAIRMATGNIDAAGDEKYDGIFLTKDGIKIGIIDWSPVHDKEMIRKGITLALNDLANGVVGRIFVVFYRPRELIEPTFAQVTGVARPELRENISLVICPPDEIKSVAANLAIAKRAPQAAAPEASGDPGAEHHG
jgi:hypothetical protein